MYMSSQLGSKDTANYSSVTAASHIPISAKHSGTNFETMLEHRVKTPPPSTISSSDITRALKSSGPLASETSPSRKGGTGPSVESRYPVQQQEGSGTREDAPATAYEVVPSRSVKFLSPVHQVVTKPPSSLLEGDHQSGHHGGSPIGPEHDPPRPTKASTPSLSRQTPGHSDSGQIDISEEPLDLLVPNPSSESLTGSDQQSVSSTSLVSQRSLPVTLGARRAFSPPRAGGLEQQLVLSTASLPQLDDKTQM